MSKYCRKFLLGTRLCSCGVLLLLLIGSIAQLHAVYASELETLTISGYVRTDDGNPIAGIAIYPYNEENGSYTGTYTSADGYYCVNVPQDWSGRIEIDSQFTPYSFEPPNHSYEHVSESLTGQNFTAIPYVHISGRICTATESPIAEAQIYVSGECYPVGIYTDADGYYALSVPRGSSGTIRADKYHYQMNPSVISYDNISSDLSDQDFEAIPYITIGGKVADSKGMGIDSVYIFGSNSDYVSTSTITDEDGEYVAYIPPGWSGNICANKPFYVFEPSSKTFENVSEDLVGQDFLAIPYNTISGYVMTISGNPVEGAWITTSENICNRQTDATGYYCLQLPPGWTGTVHPGPYQYTVSPEQRTYQNLRTDITDQNYTATRYRTISGHIRAADGSIVQGAELRVDYGGYTGCDESGYYSIGVPTGWSGTISVRGYLMSFSPPSRSYSNVQDDMQDQDYITTRLYRISGHIITDNGQPIYDACLYADSLYTNSAHPIGTEGYYELGVPPGWSGTVAAQGWFYDMEPKSRHYTCVESDISDQDFAATSVTKSLGDVKKSPDGTFVICPSVYVTACFGDLVYVESEARCFGILVKSRYLVDYMPLDSEQYISGFIATDENGERYISPTYSNWLYLSSCIKPFYMSNQSIGGADWLYNPLTGAGQRGIAESVGLNNIGLLVKTSGEVVETGLGWFRISDGSKSSVKCILPDGLTLRSGTAHCSVSGISSCEKDAYGNLQRTLKIRTEEDIVY